LRTTPSGTQAVNQGHIIQNRYPGFFQKGFRRGLEEIPILRTENSASPMTADCMTTVSFTSRIGVTNQGFCGTISAASRKNPT
jgi:hypothetical protein